MGGKFDKTFIGARTGSWIVPDSEKLKWVQENIPEKIPEGREEDHAFMLKMYDKYHEKKSEADDIIVGNIMSDHFGLKELTKQQAQEPTTPQTGIAPKLSEVIEEYIQEKKEEDWKPGTTTERDHRATFSGIMRIIGDPHIDTITVKQAKELKNVLKELPPNIAKQKKFKNKSIAQILEMKYEQRLSSFAVKKYIDRMRGVFNYAKGEKYITDNPFENIKVRTSNNSPRKLYDNEKLKAVFSTPVFTALEYDNKFEYWLPLFGLYTGARISELVQLNLTDIQTEDGVLFLNMTEEGDDQRLKTNASVRKVPVHRHILSLGFEQYLESLRKAKKEKLFHEIKPYHDKKFDCLDWSKDPSEWWSSHLKEIGIKEKGLTFHSFRHTLITELKRKFVSKEMRNEIVGHESGFGAGATYEREYLVTQKQEPLDKAEFTIVEQLVKPWE